MHCLSKKHSLIFDHNDIIFRKQMGFRAIIALRADHIYGRIVTNYFTGVGQVA